VAVPASQKIPLLAAWVTTCCSIATTSVSAGRSTTGTRNSPCWLTSSSLLHPLFASVFSTFLAECHFLSGGLPLTLNLVGHYVTQSLFLQCNRVISASICEQLSSPLRIVRMELQTTLMPRPVHWRKCSVKEVIKVQFCPRLCKTSLAGQSAGLSVPRSPVRFRQKLQKLRTQIYIWASEASSKSTRLFLTK